MQKVKSNPAPIAEPETTPNVPLSTLPTYEPVQIEIEKVAHVPIEPEAASPETETDPAPAPESAPVAPAPQSDFLVRTAFGFAGNLAETVTGIPEVNFSDDELDALAEAGTMFTPQISPQMQGLITVAMILGSKAVIYYVHTKTKRDISTDDQAGQDTSRNTGTEWKQGDPIKPCA
ncbi:MAG: hypothetical protein GY845_12675 [Planctomycetes bacterium]|nr:hypothetical protein [Planctomycetota bacterium]